MSSCGTCGFTPCKCCDGDFTVLDPSNIQKTLVASLTGCVDSIRDIYTCLGARTYTVSMIRTRWSGGSRGVGVEEVLEETMILPTPKISTLTALSTEQLSIGEEEIGAMQLSEVSARFTEDDLTGISMDGTPIPNDQNFYYEVQFPQPDGSAKRRRYSPDSAPNYDPLKFQWELSLVKIYEDRTRAGAPRA